MSRSKTFLTGTLLFLGGVLTGSSFNSVFLFIAGFAILAFTLFIAGRKFWLSGLIFVLTFSVGVLIIQKAEAERQILAEFDSINFPVELIGYVKNDPVDISGRQYFDFKAKFLIVPDYRLDISDSVRVYTDLIPEYEYGDTLRINGYLVDGRINNPNIEIAEFDGPLLTPFYRSIFNIKEKFISSINNAVLEPNASFLNGILLGERSSIPYELKASFQRTGMVHILAISGYNVTIVVSLIYGLFLLFLNRSKAFWLALAGIFIFTILTGASASVVRAAIMGSLVLLAHKEGRKYSNGQALTFTAALMVLFEPLVIQEDIGFLLSFAATAGILYLLPVIEKRARKLPKLYGIKEAALTTIAAQIMVLPLLIYYFGVISPVSLPVNVIVLPLIPLAMLLGFATGLVGLISVAAARIVGYIPWLLTSFQIEVIQFFGRFKELSVSFNLAMLIFAYLLLFYFIYRNSLTD